MTQGRRKYSRRMKSTLLMDDPRRARYVDHGNNNNLGARSAMSGIVQTEGPLQRGGWLTTLQCARCKRYLPDGERGYQINTHIVNDQGSIDRRILICGTCFVQPRSAVGGTP